MATLKQCRFYTLSRITSGISARMRGNSVHRILLNLRKDSKDLKHVRLTAQILFPVIMSLKSVLRSFAKKDGHAHSREGSPFKIIIPAGVRKEWYRDDLAEAEKKDPLPRLRNQLIIGGVGTPNELKTI